MEGVTEAVVENIKTSGLQVFKSWISDLLRSKNLADSLDALIKQDAEAFAFVNQTHNIEDEIFGKYQNFSRALTQGESSQMVVIPIPCLK